MGEHEKEAVEYMKEKNHEGMIYGIIKRFGISRYSSSYDDYVVLGMILFVKGYVELMNRDPDAEENRINAYLYQKIKWGILDELRRKKREEEHRTDVVDETSNDYFAKLPDNDVDAETLVTIKDQLSELFKRCNEFEREYLEYKLKGYTEMEISRHLKQTHTKVYRARNSIRRMVCEIFDKN